MPENLTRTITESLTHDDVQAAVLEVVRKRNPSYASKPDDVVTLSRSSSAPPASVLPGMLMPLMLHVDVKVVQDVTVEKAKSVQIIGRGRRTPTFFSDVGRITEGFDIGPGQRARYDEVINDAELKAMVTPWPTPTFSRDLESLRNLAQRLKMSAVARGDEESATYFREVMSLVARDQLTLSLR